MRGLTRNERRAIKMELKKSKFSFDKLRVIIDSETQESSNGSLWYLVGMDIHDDINGYCQRIVIPLKDEPDITKLKEQMEKMPAKVFFKPVMTADKML